MFKIKNHVGRPSNEELRKKKNKKIIITTIPIFFLILAVMYITVNGISNSMGNSVIEYYCADSSYKLDGTNCKKTLKEKSILLGDINQDSIITEEDYKLLSEYVDLVFDEQEEKSNLSDLQIKAADIDENGEVYVVDQTIMREYFEGSVSTYNMYRINVGTKRLCNDGFTLKGEYCYKDDVVKAQVRETKNVDEPAPSKTFTIHYNANGGVGSINDQVITYGTRTKLNKNTFTNQDSIFTGWKIYNESRKKWACYKNANKTSQGYTTDTDCNNYGYVIYQDEQVVAETANVGEFITMYATWSNTYFTVLYNANGGVGTMPNQKITYGVKTKLSKNLFTKQKNTFGGWKVYNNNRKKWACYKNNDKTSQGYTTDVDCNNYGYVIYQDEQVVAQTANAGETVTMYAMWNPVNYFTINYNANGGVGSMNNQNIVYGTKTQLSLNSFSKNNSIFTGWKVYNNTKKKWICYLDSSKSKQNDADESVCKKYGYVIYEDGQNVAKTADPGETITMYATWQQASYFKVKYDANGGTGFVNDQNIIYGTKTKLNNNKFSRSNYYFIGWRVYNNTKNKWICYLDSSKSKQNDADESVCKKYGYVIYEDGQNVAKTANPGETITMYALWQYSYKNISTSFNGFEKNVKGATVWPMVNIALYKNSNGTNKIGTIPQGTALKAIDMTNKTNESRSYVKVRYNNNEGYIDGWLTMINLKDVIPSALYNITNASSSMFKSRSHDLSSVTGKDIYGSGWNSDMAPIRIETAKKIQKAQTAAKAHGNKIKIYDSFRPWTAQRKVANAVNSSWFTGKTYYITSDFDYSKNTNGYYQTYIGDYKGWFIAIASSKPSSHNVAKAIDTTMVFSDDNQEIPTQSKMHELSGNSIPTKAQVDSHKGELALNYLFTNSGFYFLPSEWWHFEDVKNVGYGNYYNQIKCLGNPYSSNAYNCKVNQLKLAS